MKRDESWTKTKGATPGHKFHALSDEAGPTVSSFSYSNTIIARQMLVEDGL